MKKPYIAIAFVGLSLLTAAYTHAQDRAKESAVKEINKNSERADSVHGRKIQQQSLLNNQFEKLDSLPATPAKKKHKRSRHKYQ